MHASERPETILTVLLDGRELVEIDENGKSVISKTVHARQVHVLNRIESKIESLKQQAQLGLCNPYRDAILHGKAVWDEIPAKERHGMRPREITAVLDAILRIAKRNEH
jgi:hypothetical protein